MRCRGRILILLSTLLFLGNTVFSQEKSEEDVPEIRATRINPEKPVIDGVLNDRIWQNADVEKAASFTQLEPDEADPATESTLVAIAYDDEAVYFAFWCYDNEPDKILGQLVRRDRWAESDLITVRLDPYHDHQTGYRFELNAAGVQRDYKLYNDVNNDLAWDGVWESAVKVHSWGWSAELKIPYHCLRFEERDNQTWGLNLTRYISRKNENVFWAFSPSTEGGHVSQFGHLTGLAGITPARHLEVLPYAVSSYESTPVCTSNPDGKNFYNNTGFDIKYALTSNLIFDATINPDFGQVELDQPVLNLSTYETWYSEKRPFFMEGANLFETNFTLFYSRRIGRPPCGLDDDSDVDYYIDYPSSTSILGAAKLTGRLSSGTSIGFLNAITDKEKTEYVDVDGIKQTGIVEPPGDYSVLRVKQDVFGNSHIGSILTLASQERRHPAMTGGVDWRLFTKNGIWGVQGQVIFSRVDNENIGFGATGSFNKDAGKHIRGGFGFTVKDPHLHINKLGFTPRNDLRHTWGWVQYRTNDDWWIFKNTYNNFNLYADWNYDGANISRGGNVNWWWLLKNYWGLGGGIEFDATTYNDLETRGNGLWEIPDRPTFAWWANLESDERKKISLCINPGSGGHLEGSWWANYIGIEYRPKSNIELSIGSNFHRSFNQTRWVENRSDDSTLFASMYKDQVTPEISANITFDNNLSLQLSAEAIVATLDYRNVRLYKGGKDYEILEPGAYYVDSDGQDSTLFENRYDRNYSAINSTMILRWEFLPGSTLYIVWTRIRDENDWGVNNLVFNRDFKRLFRLDGQNVFLIKASYWWNI